jgi:hypothetical protein
LEQAMIRGTMTLIAHLGDPIARSRVMKQEITPLLRAARERGCQIQIGTDMCCSSRFRYTWSSSVSAR